MDPPTNRRRKRRENACPSPCDWFATNGSASITALKFALKFYKRTDLRFVVDPCFLFFLFLSFFSLLEPVALLAFEVVGLNIKLYDPSRHKVYSG